MKANVRLCAATTAWETVGRFWACRASSGLRRTQFQEDKVKTYSIRRENAWQRPEELEAAAERSKQVADVDFPQDIRWIRSYVVSEPEGTLGTVCIYQASGPEAIRDHA